jgi:tRNA(fMet)-specific endonuclease VapC
MTLLDTDHLSVLKYLDDPKCVRLSSRMEASPETDFETTIVTVEEQMRGWLGQIARKHDPLKQVSDYEQLANLFDFFRKWKIIHFNIPAAKQFKILRNQKIRIGTMDLKIAAIALVNDALLLSGNLRDFRQVPGLRVENWLE